jgi:hypothetical protein
MLFVDLFSLRLLLRCQQAAADPTSDDYLDYDPKQDQNKGILKYHNLLDPISLRRQQWNEYCALTV